MMLSEHKNKKSNRWEKRLLHLGVLCLVFLSFWLLWQDRTEDRLSAPTTALYYCDMESVEKGSFVAKGLAFERGELQDNKQSRSGAYSCEIPKGDGLQYALSCNWEGIQPGQVWQVGIWHFAPSDSDAKLVVKSFGNTTIYSETAVANRREGDWELFQLIIAVPFENVPNSLQTYIYTDGRAVHYFDDLSITRPRLLDAKEAQVSQLQLDIEPKAFGSLKEKRAEALLKGILTQGENDWVSARLTDSTATFPAKVRLKGDWTDHLQGEKWSFRIALKKNKSWNRLKVFSVHTPSARYHLHEWLLHQFWAQEGVLTTYYDFVQLNVNEKELGLYALEEHFDKQLLERQERRNGPILKLSEDGFWLGMGRQLENHGFQQQGDLMTIMERENADPAVFNKKTITQDADLNVQWKTAALLLESFKNGSLAIDELFDLEKLAKYYAIADLFNASHALIWHNQRFYYNPVLGKLEPIGFDGFGSQPKRRYQLLGMGSAADENPYFHQLIGNKAFLTLYYKYLDQYSSAEYIKEFLEKAAPRWSLLLPLIQLEFPDYQYQLDDFGTEFKYVHSLLQPFDNFSVKAQKVRGQDSILIGNRHALALQVIGFGQQKKEVNVPTDIWLAARPARTYLQRIQRDTLFSNYAHSRYLYQEVAQKQVPLSMLKLGVDSPSKYVFYKLPGGNQIYSSLIEEPTVQFPSNFSSKGDFSPDGKENIYEVIDNKIFFNKGKVSIESPIFIPKGYQVYFPEGGHYDFIAGAFLMSYSPIIAHGSSDQPILFESSDHTGRGVVVLQAQGVSNLSYSIFDGLTNYNEGGQLLPGAVSFYESIIELDHCIFRNNTCEDALNIIRSGFKMSDCLFSNTQGDAFDSDFSKGEIFNTQFNTIGNDALDCSGSIITVKNCKMTACGDKGISAGEESDISVFNTQVEDASMAFVAKDLSVLYLKSVIIRECRQGFVAFEKKSEYGGGHIIIEGYKAENVARLTAIGKGSKVEIQ